MLIAWRNKYYLIIFSLFLNVLMGCQSAQQIAGDEHKLVVDKWRALSKYAHGVLNRYNISLGTRLSVDATNEKNPFILDDFQLLHKTSALKIDLLNPSFERKIICTPECSFITEYMADSSINATLLKQYFDDIEFELFKFYGDLVLLEGAFKELEEINQALFPKYLLWLITENKSFNSLIGLTEYLNKSLSKSNFIEFINDPSKRYSLIEFDESLNPIFPFKSDYGNSDNQELSVIESNGELTNIEPEFILTEQPGWQENVEAIIESEFWPETLSSNDGVVASISSAESSWSLLKELDVSLGDQVCSFQEESQEQIQDVVDQITMSRIYLQELPDSIVKDAIPGTIFMQPLEERFSIIKQNIVFSQDAIAPCNIALLNQ